MNQQTKVKLEQDLARAQARLRVLLALSLREDSEAKLARSEIPELRKTITSLIEQLALCEKRVDA